MRRTSCCTERQIVAGIGVLTMGILLAAGCGQTETQRAGATPASAPAPAPAAVRFQATVYEVRVPPARLSELDAKALTAKGPTAAGFEKALAAIGPTKPLYQVDQPVNPAKDTVTITTRVPMITNTRVGEGGGRTNTVQYQNVGVIFKFGGGPDTVLRGKVLDVKLAIEVATATGSIAEMGTGVKAVNIRNYSLTYTGPVELGRPFVCLSVDATSKDEDGNAVACVCRAVISEKGP